MATSAPMPASARKRSSSPSVCGAGAPSFAAEDQHGGAVADAERAQPHRQLLLGEPAGERLREHVSGEAPLGVAHRALAHQLQCHDRHGLLEDQPLEVTEARRCRARPRAMPAVRRGPAARPAAPATAGDLRVVGGELRVVGRPRGPVAQLLAPPDHLLAHVLERLLGQRAPERLARDRLAAPGEHAHRAARGGGERSHHLVEPALLEHQPLEPLVDRDAALKHLVLLVHQPRERLLGERDERAARRAPRIPGSRAPPPPRPPPAGTFSWSKPGAESEPGQVVSGEQPDELALALLAVELDAGRQQELTARQPGRRVGKLRDVHPAHGRVRAVLARRELEPHLGRRARVR